jgi:hypothetical protein
MKTSQKFKHLLLKTIDGDGYDSEPKTEREKREFLRETFESEYGWSIERIGRHNSIKEWAQGLPTAVHFPFNNYDIVQLGIEYGYLSEQSSEREQDKYISTYWDQYLPSTLDVLMYGKNSCGLKQ